MYLIRLDDASEYMDIEKWLRIENLLNKYSIKPIVGIIPNNQDKELVSKYDYNPHFWEKAREWQNMGWAIALHGYTHVYITNSGGINPVNYRSEFAGVSLEEQIYKISNGLKKLKSEGLTPKLFFAPSHTFDENTLEALRSQSDIRIISDTIANDIYKMNDFYFIPQQSGKVRKLPFKIITFCYHPNNMNEADFLELEDFLKRHQKKFIAFYQLKFIDRKLGVYDKLLRNIYFSMRKIKGFIRRKDK